MPKMILEPTAERIVEDHRSFSPQSYLVYLFHVVTYDYVTDLVRGREVLDFGCGSGYGTARIARDCKRIVGIDISTDAVDYARGKFQLDNLQFTAILPVEQQPLPFADQSFDVVLSFQVIEHVPDVGRYLSEIGRVLRPGGIFVVATPDRSSRLLPRQKPWNMFHLHEYSDAELKDALSARFERVTIKRMGGRPDVIAIETDRTRRLRWVLLPLTLPFMPEAIRVGGLRLVRQWGARAKSLLGQRARPVRPDGAEFGFGPEHVTISDYAEPSVNLIAVAYR
jgi:SAM-dependent methyltransferase